MAEKSSSSRKPPTTDPPSARGRSPPSSSRQSKERAAKVKHRTPTPHPAKRSSQLFGPLPPPRRLPCRCLRSPGHVLRWVKLMPLFQTQLWWVMTTCGTPRIRPGCRPVRRWFRHRCPARCLLTAPPWSQPRCPPPLRWVLVCLFCLCSSRSLRWLPLGRNSFLLHHLSLTFCRLFQVRLRALMELR